MERAETVVIEPPAQLLKELADLETDTMKKATGTDGDGGGL